LRERVLPFPVSPWANQCAPLFRHTHCRCEVGVLKVLEYSVFVLTANQWIHLNVSTPLPAPDVMYSSFMAITFSTLDINRYNSYIVANENLVSSRNSFGRPVPSRVSPFIPQPQTEPGATRGLFPPALCLGL
jgi:hypothetical protein